MEDGPCEPNPRDSPSCGQDVFPMGTTLDAAHTHGVSAGKSARPEWAPTKAHVSSGESTEEGQEGWRYMPRAGPLMIYLSLVNTDTPGVLVSQPFRRPSSPPVWKQTGPLTTRSSHSSGREFMSVGKSLWWFQDATGQKSPVLELRLQTWRGPPRGRQERPGAQPAGTKEKAKKLGKGFPGHKMAATKQSCRIKEL